MYKIIHIPTASIVCENILAYQDGLAGHYFILGDCLDSSEAPAYFKTVHDAEYYIESHSAYRLYDCGKIILLYSFKPIADYISRTHFEIVPLEPTDTIKQYLEIRKRFECTR